VSSGEDIRLGLLLQYEGSGFFGWQAQKKERTVQGELEVAVERLTGQRRTVTGSGRTDRGVHATGQVAAVNVPARWTPAEFRRAANAVLPDDVWVEDARQVEAGFHPRYDAVSRTYVYHVGLHETAWSPFHRPWCWPLRDGLDRSLLQEASALLVGERSFQALAKATPDGNGHRCRVHAAVWSDWEPVGLAFTITANRFLHHMVRYLVGTMVDVARGRRPLADLSALLDTPSAGVLTSPPAPPQGLFLTRVDYPEAVWPMTEVERRPALEPPTHANGDR